MFFEYPIEVKREIVVNFGVCHSELREVRRRVDQALEAWKAGRPVTCGVPPPAYECLGCIEKEARIDAIIADTEARVRAGRRRLAGCPLGRAAVLPNSMASISLLPACRLPGGRQAGGRQAGTQAPGGGAFQLRRQ